MDKKKILDALDIRYTDLRFILEMADDCTLPAQKSSALRGGMGQMLLAQNCISDGKCEQCSFKTECPARRMMYAKYEIQPRFGGQGESMGYIIECENQKKHFFAGEQFDFHFLLFGKTIVWFSQCLQAFYMLGQQGLGKDKAQFWIRRVENEAGKTVVENSQVWLGNLGIGSVRTYALERVQTLLQSRRPDTLVFQSPVTIKYQGDVIQKFHAEALVRSILRRVYAFDCFEGREIELMMWDQDLPQIITQHAIPESVRRYSSTQGTKMNLNGIIGDVTFDALPDDLILLFAAGEKLHIGKNTSFGFGKYMLK